MRTFNRRAAPGKAVLENRYPGAHDYATDKALYQIIPGTEKSFLRNAPPINKVMYDSKIHVLKMRWDCIPLSRAFRRQVKAKAGDPRRHRVS